MFLKACRAYGMKEVDTFQTQDLYEAKGVYSVSQEIQATATFLIFLSYQKEFFLSSTFFSGHKLPVHTRLLGEYISAVLVLSDHL